MPKRGSTGTAMSITYSPRNQRAVTKGAKAERRRMFVLWDKKLREHTCDHSRPGKDLADDYGEERRDGVWQQLPRNPCCALMTQAGLDAMKFRPKAPSLERTITDHQRAILRAWIDNQDSDPKGTLSR